FHPAPLHRWARRGRRSTSQVPRRWLRLRFPLDGLVYPRRRVSGRNGRHPRRCRVPRSCDRPAGRHERLTSQRLTFTMRVHLERMTPATAAALLEGKLPPDIAVADDYPTEFSQGVAAQVAHAATSGPTSSNHRLSLSS